MPCILVGKDDNGTFTIAVEYFDGEMMKPLNKTKLNILKLHLPAEPPLSVHLGEDIVFLCYKHAGIVAIYLFDLLFEEESLPISLTPVSDYYACQADFDRMLTSEYSGQSYYDSIFSAQPTLFPSFANQANITNSSSFSTVASLIALIVDSKEGRSFRLLNTAGIIVLDIDLCLLLPKDCAQNVSFTLIDLYDFRAVVFETYSSLYTYPLVDQPVIEFETDYEYNFNGTLTVNTGSSSSSTEIFLQARNPSSLSIYKTRNKLPSSGYGRTSVIYRALNAQDTFAGRVYIPLSNYFSGHFLQYEVILLEGNAQDGSSVQIDNPKSFISDSHSRFPSNHDVQPIVFEFNYTKLIALSYNSTVVFFNCNANKTDIVFSMNTSTPQFKISRLAKIEFPAFLDEGILLLVESTGLCNEQWCCLWELFPLKSNASSLDRRLVHRAYKELSFQGIYIIAYFEDEMEITEVLGELGFGETYYVKGNWRPVRIILPDYFNFMAIIALSSNCSLYYVHFYFNYADLIDELNCSDSRTVEVLIYYFQGMTYYLKVDSSSDEAVIAHSLSSQFRSIIYYPKLIEGSYLSAQISGNYLFLLQHCDPENKLLVYDNNAPAFRNLVTVINLGNASSFMVLNMGDTLNQYKVFIYDGLWLNGTFVGQKAEFWHPISDLVPASNTENTMWARVLFSFDNLENTENHFARVRIKATSGLNNDFEYQDVDINLFNTGSFISNNAVQPHPLLSGQPIEVRDNVEFDVPVDFFVGADISYGLVVNERLGTPLVATPNCRSNQFVACVTSKCVAQKVDTHELLNSSPVYGAVVLGDYIYYSSDGFVLKVSKLGQVVSTIPICDEFMQVILIKAVKNSSDSILVICFDRYSNYKQFSLVNVISNTSFTGYFDVQVNSTVVGYDSESNSTTIFVMSQGIDMYAVVNDTIQLISSVSASSLLQVNFSPVTMTYFNAKYLLIGDAETNSVLVLANFTEVESRITFPGSSFQVAEATLTDDNKYLLVISTNTTLLRFAVTNENNTLSFALKNVVSPVDTSLDSYFSAHHIVASGDLAAFTLFENSILKMRIVNFSASSMSGIITTSPSLLDRTLLWNLAYLDLQLLSAEEFRLLVVGYYTDYRKTSSVVWNISMTSRVTVTFFKYNKKVPLNSNITFQLLASNIVSRWIGPPFVVHYPE